MSGLAAECVGGTLCFFGVIFLGFFAATLLLSPRKPGKKP